MRIFAHTVWMFIILVDLYVYIQTETEIEIVIERNVIWILIILHSPSLRTTDGEMWERSVWLVFWLV